VGRAGELGAIERALDELGPSGAVIELSGEPGIGKTRILAELRTRADRRGHQVFHGSAEELERDVPFAPFVDALDGYLAAQDPRRFERLSPEQREELARLFPGLAPLASGDTVALESERYHAHRAVRALLEELAARRPLVLALDDLHWGDEASFELLSYLLRRPARGEVLVVLAYRSRQAPGGLRAALRARAEEAILRLALEPLSRAEVEGWIETERDSASRDELFRESGGNPFYLEQLLRVSSRATLHPPAAGEEMDAEVPPAVLGALQEEIGRLTEQAGALLQGAAVAGDPFEPELAAAAAGAGQAETLDLLDELAGLDLVRPTEVPRRFRFRHPIVRRAVYESSPPGWRLAAHGRVADALADAGATALARARHVERSAQAGDADAITLLIEAGRSAAPRAPAAAAHWYGAALRLAAAEDEALRLELLVPMAMALGSAGRFEESRAALLEALDLLPAQALDLRVRLIAFLSAIEHQLGRHEEATARNLATFDELHARESIEAAALGVEVAVDGLYAGRFIETNAKAGHEALEIARARGDRPLAGAAAAVLSFGHESEGRFEEAEEARAESAALIDGLPDDELARRLDGALHLGSCEYFLERFDDSLRHLERGIAVSRSSGQGHFILPMQISEAFALVDLGRPAEARDVAESALDAARVSGNPEALSSALCLVCWATGAAGDVDTAMATGQEGAALARSAEESLISRAFHAHFAAVCLDAGDPERCVAELELSGSPEFESFEPGRRALWLAVMARATLALGREDEADAWMRRAEAQADGLPLPVAAGRVGRAQAEVTMAGGDAPAAGELALAAAEAQEGRGARIEAGRSRTLAGRALGQAGDRERAAEELRRAYVELRACGAGRWADEAARELRRLGRRVPRAGGAGEPEAGVLSDRESEIAELVTAGKTNKEIGATLFLSEKTIENHLSRIFGKLGISRRAQVAGALGRRPR
jgi:DNA-binding CsgD family transcriptional regulator